MTEPMTLQSHAKWLRKAAEEIRDEGHAGWGNTCEFAADAIDAEILARDAAVPVMWVNEYTLRRVAKNNGILATTAFDERVSNSRNNVQNIPLYTDLPTVPVGTVVGEVQGGDARHDGKFMSYVLTVKPIPVGAKLYTAPPAQPVGMPDAHTLWAAAQLVPGEGIEDGVLRIEALLTAPPAQPEGVTHCDNCGCTWLDDGLNPVGCPYCNPAHAEDKCFACGRAIGRLAQEHLVDTRDGQKVYVGSECYKKIKAAGTEGWKPPKGGPRLWLCAAASQPPAQEKGHE